MQVVEHEQQWPADREGVEYQADLLEQAQPSPRQRARRGLNTQLDVVPQRLAEGFDHGLVRHKGLLLGAPVEGAHTQRTELRGELAYEPRLSDARLTADEHELASVPGR